MAEKEDTLTVQRRVYIGRRENTRGTLSYFYADAETLDSWWGTRKNLLPGAKIGTVIDVTFTDDNSYYTSGEHAPKATGHLDNEQKILEWQLEDRVHSTMIAQARENERIAKSGIDPLEEHLAPIREALAGMGYDRRRVAVAHIIDALLYGGKR